MWRRFVLPIALSLVAGATVTFATPPAPAAAAAVLPSGFSEQIVYSGLNHPTKVVFAPDGRVFVAEKGGLIKVYDSLSDPTPDVFADLRTQVHDYGDHGLLGLAVPPNFPTSPWVYALYTADAPIGGTAPVYNDGCGNECTTSGRLSRLQANGNQMTGSEQVLLNDWCELSETHSIGTVAFGPDGKLYVSGGEGAAAFTSDWGQVYNPSNACGDPPSPVGGAMNPPTAEGGALRSQSPRRTDGPARLSGTLIRVDPDTGAGLPDNPFAASADPNARRIVAYGLRNPFRFTFRPGTGEVWFGDVGWRDWEEIDRLQNPLAANVTNFGWPCYEGNGRQPEYDGDNLNLCESLYAAGTATGPYYTYNHGNQVVPGESCPTGGSSPTGVAFYPGTGGNYPAMYRNALFWGDYSRGCIWAMLPNASGVPDPANIQTFDAGAAGPVDLQVGPGGDLYYVDIEGGTVRRIRFASGNHPPVAAMTANPTSGQPPLTVSFDASGSSDPDPGDILSYAWDFTSDGTTDATGPTASFSYASAGTYTARLTVTDSQFQTDTKTVTISVANGAPTPVIDTPTSATRWAVGDTVTFSGHASDPQDGVLPASALHWQLLLHHCTTPTSCHTHFVQTWDGVASGSFTAPDHEFPSYLEMQLTAVDSTGTSAMTSARIDPATADLTFNSSPSGLSLSVGSTTNTTPFTKTVVIGSTNSVNALSPQTLGSTTYQYGSWSDGGAQTHVITAPATATAYTATYTVGGTLPDLTGTVTGAGGLAVAGANVVLTPGGRSATSDASGRFTFTGVAAGSYTVTASLATGSCAPPASVPVTMNGSSQNVTVALQQRADAFGYTCTDGARTYVAAGTALSLTGDDNTAQVMLPFPVKLYGTSYSTAWVDTNGVVSFANPVGSAVTWNTHIPSTGQPNAAVFPFWDDFVIDASASVRAATTGTAPNRQYIVEWRNATFYANPSARVNAEVQFSETTGEITFVYQGIDNVAMEQGSTAVLGIENAAGTVGFEYGYHQTLLKTDTGVTFRPQPTAPPQFGSVSGKVTAAGAPVAGATVTLNPGSLSTTTAADGTYQFASVVYGTYTVAASIGTGLCTNQSASAPVTVNGAKTVDLALTGGQRGDAFGYTCTDGARTYVAAGTALALTGDDAIKKVTLPFPVKLYGTSYTAAWVDTNGVVEFVNPGGSAVTWNTHIPNTGQPNAAVFPFWDDFIIDASASVRTATTGTAPNRQYIVEWRNAAFFANRSARVTVEVQFSETTGEITFVYQGIDNVAMEQGSTAVLGIENAAGTVGFEYSYHQPAIRTNNGVTFRPPG